MPGLTTEISQGGMALYGGVPLQPGDVMAVEFQTSNRLRVAALVRDRYGYCFGLEFLGLLPSEVEISGSDLFQMAGEPDGITEADQLVVAAKTNSAATSVQTVYGEDEMLALYLKKHEAYLRQKDLELKRLRYEIQEIRQSRKEIETLLSRQVLGRSG